MNEESRRRRAPWRRLWLTAGVMAVALAGLTVVAVWHRSPPSVALPLRAAGEIALPGDSSRFDYASLDAARGLLFVAHLGASEIVVVDVHAGAVVRAVRGVEQVHGVLVVPERHRVYATATGANQILILDEDTGAPLARAPTGDYPDGLAYDPIHATIWTTNKAGGSETVIDADSGQVRGTVQLGGQAGNVAYDPQSRQILADVQTRNEVAVIDPGSLTVTWRVALPGCDHNHGLALDPAHRLAFVACDANATLLTVDMNTWKIVATQRVGDSPDVLAYDPAAGRLYVAAESGRLTILDERNRNMTVAGRSHLADAAHVVAVDPTTHRSFYPVPHGRGGGPALLTYLPTR